MHDFSKQRNQGFLFNYKNTLLLVEHWSELLLYSVFVDCFEVYIYNRDNILRVLNQCYFHPL